MERTSELYKAYIEILETELISSKATAKKAPSKDYELLDMGKIYDFALTLNTADVKHLFRRQADYNGALVREGIEKEGGNSIGKILFEQSSSVYNLARATTVAALDAWVAGSELPAIVNCGSAYQGIGVCQPVVEYVMELGADNDMLYRALAISNLTAIYFTEGAGKSRSLCPAACTGVGVGAAICYLRGGKFDDVSKVVDRTLRLSSGLSCTEEEETHLLAAEFSLGVEAGLLSMELWFAGRL